MTVRILLLADTHLGFDDPASVVGSEEERLSVFREIRDDIIKRLPEFLDSIFGPKT